METTRAAVCETYGPPEVIRVVERPRPVPREDEVLVRARAVTVNSGDARMRAARVPWGMRFPFRLAKGWSGPRQGVFGFDVAGDVAAVGAKVTSFRVGDRVVASRGFELGCHAEHIVIPERGAIAKIPDGMAYGDAVSLLFGGSTCIAFFEAGKLAKGERILINGASGAVGVLAIQLAKQAGAIVTAVCSGASADLVRRLGADHVIDYTKDDFTKSAERWDVIMDNHGNAPYARVKHLLAPGGRFLLVIGDLGQMLAAPLTRAVISTNHDGKSASPANYRRLLDLAASGAIQPVIGKTLPFDEVVEAHRLVDSGHKKGSVVLAID